MKETAARISQDFVYSHPTIRLLAAGIRHLIEPTHNSRGSDGSLIQSFIEKYTPQLPTLQSATLTPGNPVVVLTGSTGHLGCQILASLLSRENVAKVYTFNRGGDITRRQKLSFKAVGLPVALLEDNRLVQLQCDLGVDGLGLSGELLQEVSVNVSIFRPCLMCRQIGSTATHVIHNAWKVDFNLSLLSFEGHIASTINLLEFSLSFLHKPHFLFTSSISVASGWDTRKGPVPESVLETNDSLQEHGNGYAASKYVVEHVSLSMHMQRLPLTRLSDSRCSEPYWCGENYVPPHRATFGLDSIWFLESK